MKSSVINPINPDHPINPTRLCPVIPIDNVTKKPFVYMTGNSDHMLKLNELYRIDIHRMSDNKTLITETLSTQGKPTTTIHHENSNKHYLILTIRHGHPIEQYLHTYTHSHISYTPDYHYIQTGDDWLYMIGQFAADTTRGIATTIVKSCLLTSNGKLRNLRQQRIALGRQIGSSIDMLASTEYCSVYDRDRYEILIVAFLRVQLLLRFVFVGLSSVVGKADELIRGHESKHGGFSVLHGFLREVFQVLSDAEISEMSAQSDILKLIDQICKLYKNTNGKIIPYDHYMSRLGFPTSIKDKDVVLKWIYNMNNTDDQLKADILSFKINNIDLSHYNSYRISMLM